MLDWNLGDVGKLFEGKGNIFEYLSEKRKKENYYFEYLYSI
jgi:hypothetical protein